MSARLDAALAFARQGIHVLPIHEIYPRPDGGRHCSCNHTDCKAKGKHPRTKNGVDEQTTDQEVIKAWWKRWPNANVAIATGKKSDVDVLDVDGEIGRASLADLEKKHGPLPLTPVASTGKGLHYFFKHDDRVWNRVALADNVDVRTTGGYVVAPPSVHVSGRTYAWQVPLEDVDVAPWPEWLVLTLLKLRESERPAPVQVPASISVEGQTLYGAKVIASCLAAMEQARAPEGERSGNRNFTLNKQAYILGQLEGAGEPLGNACEQLRAIARNKGMVDHEITKSFSSGFEDGRKNPKRIKMRENPEQFEPPITTPPKEQAPPPAAPPPPPPPIPTPTPQPRPQPKLEIEVVAHELERMTDDAERALIRSKLPIYSRFGELARVREGSGGRLMVDAIPDAQLLKLMSMSAVWFKWIPAKKGDEFVKDPCKPPADVVQILSTEGEWKFMELHQVYDAPTIRPDGTILQKPGYDLMTRAIYAPRAVYPVVADKPTRDDALAALNYLADPLVDFPFKRQSDASAWVAMLLTVLGRPSVEGATPLFVIRATDRGVGKSLLADMVNVIATGNPAARMTYGSDQDEENKRMIALGRESAPFALIDNVSMPLGGDVLAAATTGRVYKGRDLGHSRMIEVPVPVLCATGVNVMVKDDLGRRVIPIDLDPGVENPEERKNFKYKNVLRTVAERRSELVVAALTILRAFHLAGLPQDANAKTFGSFEDWSERIRHCLIWLGLQDPCLGREEIREQSDQDRDAVLSFLNAWHDKFGAYGSTAREALEIARQRDTELLEAMVALDTRLTPEKLNSTKLSNAIQKVAGRIVGGLRIEKADRSRHGFRWRVLQITTPATPSLHLSLHAVSPFAPKSIVKVGEASVAISNSQESQRSTGTEGPGSREGESLHQLHTNDVSASEPNELRGVGTGVAPVQRGGGPATPYTPEPMTFDPDDDFDRSE